MKVKMHYGKLLRKTLINRYFRAPNRDTLLNMKEAPVSKKFTIDFRNLDLLILKRILDFLYLEELDAFSRVNRDCNQIFKIYMVLRVPVETNRIKFIEQENNDLIQTIQQKRVDFYEQYEIPAPDKERAISLLTEITYKVIIFN